MADSTPLEQLGSPIFRQYAEWQLRWLESEILFLRRQLALTTPPANSPESTPAPDSFSALEGIWAGLDISDEDIRASRLTASEAWE